MPHFVGKIIAFRLTNSWNPYSVQRFVSTVENIPSSYPQLPCVEQVRQSFHGEI